MLNGDLTEIAERYWRVPYINAVQWDKQIVAHATQVYMKVYFHVQREVQVKSSATYISLT